MKKPPKTIRGKRIAGAKAMATSISEAIIDRRIP
jgi:hypothetical protein